ncbi:MAG: response regulator transcription factor [Lautropia sp.]|nr:response regulator transcription factor [Lautropia sp.]
MKDRAADILLVDDDELVQLLVEDIVTQLGHRFTVAADGASARAVLARQRFDLVILDRRLPDIDGLLLAPMLKNDRKLPFIVLSSLDATSDQVLGFELGALDYICKPVEPAVLRARIQAHLAAQRPQDDEQHPSVGDSLQLDALSRRLKVGDRTETLSPAETRLLTCLIRKVGIPCDRTEISRAICGREWVYGDRTVDVLVSRLRRRLQGSHTKIITVHGLGYALVEADD